MNDPLTPERLAEAKRLVEVWREADQAFRTATSTAGGNVDAPAYVMWDCEVKAMELLPAALATIDAQDREIEELRGKLASLPTTADGVKIVPGMKVWSARTKTVDTEDGAFLVGKVGDGPGWFHSALLREAGPLYATRDAATAASDPDNPPPNS